MYRMANPYRTQGTWQPPSWDDQSPWDTQAQQKRPNDPTQFWKKKGQDESRKRYSAQTSFSVTDDANKRFRSDSKKRRFNDKKGESKSTYLPSAEDAFKQIGSSETYNDVSTEASYDWMAKSYPPLSREDEEATEMKTLKNLASMTVAERAHNLTSFHLQTVQWNRMKDVWTYICSWRRDSFLVFQLFASVFAKEQCFECHPALQNIPLPKKQVILKNTLPQSKNYRVERFFSNIRISHFVSSLNSCQFEHLTILELSKPMSYDDLIYLTNLTHLTALRVSRLTQVPDPVIARWCTAIKTNKWSKLQMLSIPLITQDQFRKLQDVAAHCKLMYLEVQSKMLFNMRRDWQNLDYDSWQFISDGEMERLSWGLKVQTMLRTFAIEGHTIQPPRDTIWLDLNVMNHKYNDRAGNMEVEFDHIWKLGEIMVYTQAVVLKKKLEVVVKEEQRPVNNGKKPIMKKKLIRNAKSFFDI